MSRALLFWAALAASSTSLSAQEIDITQEDLIKVVTTILEYSQDYNIYVGNSPHWEWLSPDKLSFWPELTLEGRIWELRYSTDTWSGDFSGTFSLDETNIPSRFTSGDIPDFTFSWEVEWTLEYVAERLDYVFYIYSWDNLALRWGLWISKYDFLLNGAIHWSIESSNINESISWYFSAQTKQPLYNPALIAEWEYTRDLHNGNRYALEARVRYEPWNTQASVWFWYDLQVWRGLFLTADILWEYRDYHKELEKFDGFEDGWEHAQRIGVSLERPWWDTSIVYDIGEENFLFWWKLRF